MKDNHKLMLKEDEYNLMINRISPLNFDKNVEDVIEIQPVQQYKIELLEESFMEMNHKNILLYLNDVLISYKDSKTAMDKVINITHLIVDKTNCKLLDYVNLLVRNKCWNELFKLFEKNEVS